MSRRNKVTSGKGGIGMGKHRKSGVAHNHAVSRARTREYNKMLEEQAALREKRKGKSYNSVRELFDSELRKRKP